MRKQMNWRETITCVATVFATLLTNSCTDAGKNNEAQSHTDYQFLKKHFSQPPQEYGINCWWWWLNGNVTREAIKSDLEAMKARHFQGATIVDAGGDDQRGNRGVTPGPQFGSQEWIDLFVYALDEAKRLGLEISFNVQSGWNLGGPCITPQYAAKQLTYTEQQVAGGQPLKLQLDQPQTNKDFYRDIAVLAFPSDNSKQVHEGISQLDLKLGFHELGGSASDSRILLGNSQQAGKGKEKRTKPIYQIDPAQVIDLTAQMNAEGQLDWADAPAGTWTILRIGYTCTRAAISTASRSWTGNVMDYMSPEAFDYYWETVIAPILQAAGERHVGSTLKYMETDSWECGGMNWTDAFANEFSAYCGYDLKPFLPLVAGHIVKDIDTSNAFLADFRKTIGHLIATHHYKRFAEYAHAHHMGILPESAGPHAGPFDGIKNYGFSDIMMSEFWAPSPHRPRVHDRFFIKQASSAAHIYGKPIVGAESFTTIGPHWNDELWHDQKPAFDHEVCAGLNRVYLHTFTCSPASEGIPGQEYFAGTHINPRLTWWQQSAPFIDYLRRVQMLAQTGKFEADVLYYYGDHVPNVYPFKQADLPGALPGFDYDVTDETILLQLTVKDGYVTTPSGCAYRVLVLPGHHVLSLAALKKVESLASAGACILGPKPLKAVSLVGGTECAAEFKQIADKLWGTTPDSVGQQAYGKGRIAWGQTAREWLLAQNLSPDFSLTDAPNQADFEYIHYRNDSSHIYFVSNQTAERRAIRAHFRVNGLQPELWDAVTGEITEAKAFEQQPSGTTVPLTLEPYASLFVVFHQPISPKEQGTERANMPDYQPVQTLAGAWTVHFDPAWGGPESVVFPKLTDWTTSSEPGIKYYSGTARYEKSFVTDFTPLPSARYFIQLENVKDVGIASVCLNRKELGITWTKPFRIEITDALQQGENHVAIEVTNSWYNRVAGDELNTGPKRYTRTNIILKNDFAGRPRPEIPLEPSGLLGPVTIQFVSQ